MPVTAAEALVEALAEQPPPVGAQRRHGGRVGDDRRRPVDGVDLGHQRGVHEPRLVVEVVVGRSPDTPRARRSQIALCSRMKRSAGGRGRPRSCRRRRSGRRALRVSAGRARASSGACRSRRMRSACGEVGIAAVDLRSVPPVGVAGDEGRRPVASALGSRLVRRDLHRVLRPRVVVGERDRPRVRGLALAVAEPVVHLELDPDGRQQVERRRRLELVAREEPPADGRGFGVRQLLRLDPGTRARAGRCARSGC